ncbi:hypothetical protein BU23DRAFT_553671 [Bimuria novae-zelandiae CBS 107.79]|uniref:Uncharacterized protein n=1 Tax=Bimuria novae-zelandiae CBS 107.79 TaxID=1447943 RepID=A0A6A5VB14_9PLEO|nr:hypothetical protein BU23DRAFT_553671 [Bimuria novae-zelandiae CBS 107.79]
MQNYGQNQAAYQMSGSTTGFAPPVPPPYGAPQGHPAAPPQTQNQWAPPVQNQTPAQQQWNQPPQQVGGYNPGVYGAMPGGHAQGQHATAQPTTAYPPQQDVPPPPPPKPAAFASTPQQNTQAWGQHTGYGTQQAQQGHQIPQQPTAYTTQGQQGGNHANAAPQQPYSNVAAPPPSQTPGGSYFPPSQTPQAGARPSSIYGAEQTGTYSTPSSAVAQHPPQSVFSPNEQNPVYIPPSLTGQGVQSYVPSNTNPMPGVYVPPPPDVPAWQQASHAPLQGGKKFKYTKPAPDPNSYGQVPPGVAPLQVPVQYGQQTVQPPQQYAQPQYPPTQQAPQYGQPVQNQYTQDPVQQQGQYGGNAHTQYSQPAQQVQYAGQPAPRYDHPHDQPALAQPYEQQPQNQWQSTPVGQDYAQQAGAQGAYGGQQQAWQPGHQAQNSGTGQGIQAPKPVSGQTGTTPPGFVNEPSPQSQPVSPIQHRFSTSFASGHAGIGRTGSVSSIALGAIHAQRAGNRTESPRPPPPPSREDTTRFSALGTGGPSDWEHFGGGGEEVDDEELFVAKKDGRQGVAVQLDSVEVPLQQVSPPQAQGEWPTPPVQPATESIPHRDSYQPTPPPNMATHRPPSQPPQHSFVVGDVPPAQPSQQGFVMGDPVAVLHLPQQQVEGFVMEDAIVAPLRVSLPSSQRNTPVQQQIQHQPPSAPHTSMVMGENSWNTAQQLAAPLVDQQTKAAHVAELKAKDDTLERLRTLSEKEKAGLNTEIEQLKALIETTKTHAEYERDMLAEQIEAMKVTAEQAKNNSNALTKEKDSTIERLKEDGEGKEDTIREKDTEIARLREELKANEGTIAQGHAFVGDLKQQLEIKDTEISNLKQQIENNQTAERLASDLRQQLEAEKSKEPPKPTPASLIPDLDPWYAGSLERYITMLRSEAHEPSVEDKIKVFSAFLKTESTARGLEYYSAPPPSTQLAQHKEENIQASAQLPRDTNISIDKKSLNVQVPLAAPPEDDVQYSPGGRPIVQHRPTLKSEEFKHPQQSFSVSSQSTTVLTPTSSQDDSFDKTPTPMQSPPTEPQAQPQYKAYVPPSITQVDSAQNLHRQSISSASPGALNPAFSYGSKKDEVFFGASPGTGSPSSRPNTGGNATPDVDVPAALFTQHPKALATKVAPKEAPVEKLTKLLPTKIGVPQPNPHLEAIRSKLAEIPVDTSLADLTASWEKSASLTRKKNDEARRKRQEESEEETNQLFNEHEISYADIAVLEDEQKENERKLKADEDRDEYDSYVENVFEKVYDGLQQQIKRLMDLYVEAESSLATSVSGVRSFEGSDEAITEDCLKLLEDLFEAIEQRHEKVVEAIVERDRRYKKTEIQPLYAAGNITKMKQVEKRFAAAEKEALQRARDEKAGRVEKFVSMVEATIIAAVGTEQQEIQEIIGAARDLLVSPDTSKFLTPARETVLALGDSSKSLLQLLNDIEIDLGSSVLEAALLEAKADKEVDKVAALEKQIKEREIELREEFKRKEAVLDQDREEIDKVVKAKRDQAPEGGDVELTEEQLRKERLSKALEEAKRRNGDL